MSRSLRLSSCNRTRDINAIRGGSRLVKSDGTIKELGELHAVSCTKAGGMSVIQLCCRQYRITLVVGLQYGGPAAPLNRTLIDLLYAAKNYDGTSAQSILKTLLILLDLNLLITQIE